MITSDILNETQTCPAVSYQSASICVPVTVTPFAQAGVTSTRCCGTPVVTPGRDVCAGVRNGASDQDICTSCDILPEIPTVPTIPSVV